MLEVSYGEIRNPGFKHAFIKVSRSTGFKDVRVIRNIVRLANILDKADKEIHEEWVKVVKNYAVLDEKGEFVREEENGKPRPDSFRLREEFVGEPWVKVQKDFADLKYQISANKIYLHELVNCDLSPVELAVLEPLLHDLSEDAQPGLKAMKN